MQTTCNNVSIHSPRRADDDRDHIAETAALVDIDRPDTGDGLPLTRFRREDGSPSFFPQGALQVRMILSTNNNTSMAPATRNMLRRSRMT